MFSNPLFLWAAAAAVVPLILHLLQRRRILRLPFSTLRFLKLAQRRSSRRVRMENFLLWLLRTALMLAIAMAFAMPTLRSGGPSALLGRQRRDVALVLDASYSMGYQIGRETAWDRAVRAALNVVDGLAEGDRACVFLAADVVQPVFEQLTADRALVRAQLKTLRCGATPSRILPALQAAADVIGRETARRDREIHILTDGQALPWAGFEEPGRAPSADAWNPDRVDRHTAFFITLTGAPAPQNVTPVEVTLDPPLVMAGQAARAVARLAYSGPRIPAAVSLEIDGQAAADRGVSAEENEQGTVTLGLPPLPAGVHTLRLETPPDNLPADDAFYLILRTREALPALCVGTPDDTFYLVKALHPVADAPSTVEVKRVDPDGLDAEDLRSYACVFLCNALPLSGQAVLRLEEYARSGGLVVVFPGDRASAADYEPWEFLPAPPGAPADVELADRKRALRWSRPRDRLLADIELTPDNAPVVTVRRELPWGDLRKDAEVLAESTDGRPFLAARTVGRGRALLFAVSADRSWATFPLSPFFLPLAHQIVRTGAGLGREAPSLQVTRRLSLTEHVPEAGPESVLLGPDRSPVPVRSGAAEQRAALFAEDLLEPGHYWLAGAGGGPAVPVLALNLDRTESDLTPADKVGLPGLLRCPHVLVAAAPEELPRLLEEHRTGRRLGEPLLWAALLLALVEAAYANWRARPVAPLSESLGIEPSGRVGGG